MPRVKTNVARKRRVKRLLKRAKGYSGARHSHMRTALVAVERAEEHAKFGRKLRKRDFRRLWITRISAAAKERGTNYSKLIAGLKAAGVDLNRKQMSELAIADPAAFDELVKMAQPQAD